MMHYNKLNAATYEVIEFISHFWPSIIKNVWIQKVRIYCRDDWAEFRTQVTLKEVDEEIRALHESWDTQEAEDFYPGFQAVYFSEDNRDEPLGGEMGYSYELFEDKTENYDDQSS
jgi:hypothetical protein